MHKDIYSCKTLLTVDNKISIYIFRMTYHCNGLKTIVRFTAFIITVSFWLHRFYKIQQIIEKFLYLTWFPTISTLIRRYNEMLLAIHETVLVQETYNIVFDSWLFILSYVEFIYILRLRLYNPYLSFKNCIEHILFSFYYS